MMTYCKTCLPPAEIKQTENGYIIIMELPGSFRDDIKIWQENGILTITGEKKAPSGDRIFSERVFGEFTRSFRLPEDVDLDKIEANYSDGVITVEIPKQESVKPRNIKIK
ncbi:MAG: Hsp20/alpha crystallin family protein [candidate division Zixibacteria bacterium]|nr:Hsp20/alpha crystallin family protein [candidate division Zixibacteria bacterium]